MSRRSATEEDPDEAWVIATAHDVGGQTPGGFGIGDDAALVSASTVVTTDSMVEGVHWDHRLSAADVGWKLVAVNVSDIGAMGAQPAWATLAMALPAPLDRGWVRDFFVGFAEAAAHFGLALVGGDTTRSPGPRVLTLTVGGEVARPVRRQGALPGDDLWVTGELGRAGEAFLAEVPSAAALAWLRRPDPPIRFAAALAERGLAHAMIDVSDGLARDLGRVCRASGVGAWVDPARLPGGRPIAQAVAFGEDYELGFAAASGAVDAICSLATMHGSRVTRVGAFTQSADLVLLGHASWPVPRFDHFTEVPR